MWLWWYITKNFFGIISIYDGNAHLNKEWLLLYNKLIILHNKKVRLFCSEIMWIEFFIEKILSENILVGFLQDADFSSASSYYVLWRFQISCENEAHNYYIFQFCWDRLSTPHVEKLSVSRDLNVLVYDNLCMVPRVIFRGGTTCIMSI